ncbi:hypothetical protein [Salinigranum sp. GCM10025319]|uniref:hypothetical protein n=1 Tax=Salinigranum sp. GCM10025319 TaxID=3252687 RepID=UPI00361B1999
MRQPSTSTPSWAVPLAVVLFATLVLQTAPERSGPFVDLGRLLSRAALVGATALLSWRLWTVERGAGRPAVVAVSVVVLAALVGVALLAVLLGVAGYGNVLGTVVGTVVAVLIGIGGAAVVVTGPDGDGDPNSDGDADTSGDS